MRIKGLLNEFTLVEKIYMVVTLVFFAVISQCACYTDVLITANHGIRLWDVLFNGSLLDFYEFNRDALLICGPHEIVCSAAYDFVIYAIFALWNFPVWFLGKLFGVAALDTVLGTLWAKAISIPSLLLVTVFMYKIGRLFQDCSSKRIAMVLYLFITSIYTVTYVTVMGQYDVITLAIVLAGVYAYLWDKDRLFLVLFSIAIPTKAFALLVFVPLLLYKQKNMLRIVLSLILALVPMALMRILIPIAGSSNIGLLFPQLLSNELEAGYGSILFFTLYAVFCLVCYITPYCEDFHARIKWVLYICMMGFALFVFTCRIYPYWYIYIAPFVFLLMLSKDSILGINVFIETIFSCFTVVAQMTIYNHCFSSEICGNTMITALFPKSSFYGTGLHQLLGAVLGDRDVNVYKNVLCEISASFAVAAFAVFCVINYPKFCEKKCITMTRPSVYLVYAARFLIAVMICMVPIVGYIVSG